MTIHGPSVLVRKKLAEKYAISANYYMDMVTSASIDVEVSRRQRIQGRAQPVQPRARVPARQDHVQPRLHQQQRGRLPGRDDLVRHQPGPVRRPDDDHHGLLARQGRRAPPRHDHRPDRSDLQGADRPLELSRRRVADPDQEPHQLAAAGSDHRRGLPQQSVSLVPLRQPERRPAVRAGAARSIRARAPATPSRSTRATTCPIARPCTAATASSRTPGASTPTRSKLGYTHPMGTVDRSKSAIATTRRATPTSTATCSNARTSRTSWRATRSCRRSTARRCSVGATYEFAPNGWRFIKKGTLNLLLRPHRVRLRGLPRRALLAAAGRRPELPPGRQRAALHVRRQRLPGVRVGLVLSSVGRASARRLSG